MDWNPKPLDPADVKVQRRGKGKPLVLIHCLGMDFSPTACPATTTRPCPRGSTAKRSSPSSCAH